jgi:hypothetical protein
MVVWRVGEGAAIRMIAHPSAGKADCRSLSSWFGSLWCHPAFLMKDQAAHAFLLLGKDMLDRRADP